MSEPRATLPDDRRRTAPIEQADPDRPYRIDWIEADALGDGAPGRLGLTFLPGKHGVSTRYPGLTYRRSLQHDLDAMRALGVAYLLLLVEDAELEQWGDPEIVAAASAHGIVIRRHPVPDGGTPRSTDDMRGLLEELRAARRSGNVAVACMGGVGRTGLVAACALAATGLDAGTAIERVRAVRHPDAVETSGQQAFVERFAAEVRAASQPD